MSRRIAHPRAAIAALLFATGLGSCTDDSAVDGASGADAASFSDVGGSAATSEGSLRAPVVELAQFVGSWDPDTAQLSFALDAPNAVAVTLREVPQALYC